MCTAYLGIELYAKYFPRIRIEDLVRNTFFSFDVSSLAAVKLTSAKRFMHVLRIS